MSHRQKFEKAMQQTDDSLGTTHRQPNRQTDIHTDGKIRRGDQFEPQTEMRRDQDDTLGTTDISRDKQISQPDTAEGNQRKNRHKHKTQVRTAAFH